ncbi:hypothetical protein FPV67DRAFT_1421371, partial [Lyophyllum atratum]
STIILDEAQERMLATDYLMAFLTTLAKPRSELTIIIISAKLDTNSTRSSYGSAAPVFKVPGRIHPTEVHYTTKREPD